MSIQKIGIIPDGNRRYADKEEITYQESYQRGFDKGKEVFDWCIEHPTINKAIIYALSTENVARNEEELSVLYDLYSENLSRLSEDPQIHDNEVNVKVVGRSSHMNALKKQIDELEKATGDYGNYQLRIALGYGGRAEIIDAARKIAEEGKDFTEGNFNEKLYSDFDLDMVIRTGGYQRLSNFQLWQSAYSELYFTDKLWPEFDRDEFNRSLEFYESTKRKFGQ